MFEFSPFYCGSTDLVVQCCSETVKLQPFYVVMFSFLLKYTVCLSMCIVMCLNGSCSCSWIVMLCSVADVVQVSWRDGLAGESEASVWDEHQTIESVHYATVSLCKQSVYAFMSFINNLISVCIVLQPIFQREVQTRFRGFPVASAIMTCNELTYYVSSKDVKH